MRNLIFGIILVFVIASFCDMAMLSSLKTKSNNLDVRVTNAEKTLVTLHTCFPGGHYNPDAAPTCPAFKEWLTGELNKNEATFTKENDNATSHQ